MKKESLAAVVAPLLVLASLAALIVWLWRGGEPDQTVLPVPDAPAQPAGPGMPAGVDPETVPDGYRSVTVWLDGWSQTIVGRTDLRVVARSARGTQLSVLDVELVPATLADVESLAGRDAWAVTQVAARTVRFDVELLCAADGCVSQRGPAPLEWVVSPPQVPSLGEVYESWGVEHGLWRATVVVPVQTASVVVGFFGWAPASFTLPVATSPESVLGGGDDSGGQAADAATNDAATNDAATNDAATNDAAANDAAGEQELTGGGSASPDHADVVVAGAFGVMFPLQTNWMNTEGLWARQPYALAPVAEAAGDPADLADLWSDPSLLWRGLASPQPKLVTLSPSLLTMLSSPTIGCNGALCVPAVAQVRVDAATPLVASACPHPEFPERSGLYPPEASAVAVVHQLRVITDLAGPIRQIGADLPAPDQWPGHVVGGTGPFTGDVPLVSGQLTLRVQQVWLLAGADLDPLVVYTRRPAVDDAPLGPSSWTQPWWELVACP